MEELDSCGIHLGSLENDIDRAGDAVAARGALQAEVDRLNRECSTSVYFKETAARQLQETDAKSVTATEIGPRTEPDAVRLDVKPIMSGDERRTCDALMRGIEQGDPDALQKAFACASNMNVESWKVIEANLSDELIRRNPLLVIRSAEDSATGKLYLVIEQRQIEVSRSVLPKYPGEHSVGTQPATDPAEMMEGARVVYGGKQSRYYWSAHETEPPRELISFSADLPAGWLQSRPKN